MHICNEKKKKNNKKKHLSKTCFIGGKQITKWGGGSGKLVRSQASRINCSMLVQFEWKI